MGLRPVKEGLATVVDWQNIGEEYKGDPLGPHGAPMEPTWGPSGQVPHCGLQAIRFFHQNLNIFYFLAYAILSVLVGVILNP